MGAGSQSAWVSLCKFSNRSLGIWGGVMVGNGESYTTTTTPQRGLQEPSGEPVPNNEAHLKSPVGWGAHTRSKERKCGSARAACCPREFGKERRKPLLVAAAPERQASAHLQPAAPEALAAAPTRGGGARESNMTRRVEDRGRNTSAIKSGLAASPFQIWGKGAGRGRSERSFNNHPGFGPILFNRPLGTPPEFETGLIQQGLRSNRLQGGPR